MMENWEQNMAAIVQAGMRDLDQQFIDITVGDQPLRVEVASSSTTRMAGLANRSEMPEDGMLFVYDSDVDRGFHRTTMRFPISIRFYDAAGELVHEDHESEVVEPGVLYRYVLETRLGVPVEGKLSIIG